MLSQRFVSRRHKSVHFIESSIAVESRWTMEINSHICASFIIVMELCNSRIVRTLYVHFIFPECRVAAAASQIKFLKIKSLI
jgi:hypothetical protein